MILYFTHRNGPIFGAPTELLNLQCRALRNKHFVIADVGSRNGWNHWHSETFQTASSYPLFFAPGQHLTSRGSTVVWNLDAAVSNFVSGQLSSSFKASMLSVFLHGNTPGGRHSTKFYTGRLPPPNSNPLPFYIPFLTEKVPLSYTFHWKIVPLSHTYLKTLHPFSKPLEGSLLVVFM